VSDPTLPECGLIFKDPRLCLVVWDRGELRAHEGGLRFTRGLLESCGLAGYVMPLLRPAGRSCANAADIRRRAKQWKGTGQAWSCELWLQVEAAIEGELWAAVTDEINGKGWNAEAGLDLGDAAYARWEPIGNPSVSMASRWYLPNLGSPERQTYDALGEAHKPALLKLVWWQGVATLVAECVQPQGIRRFDPRAHRDAMADLLERMLRPICLADFGIGKASDVVDPSRFGASHLACYALNAMSLADLGTSYDNGKATWPSCCDNLSEYLRGIRIGSW